MIVGGSSPWCSARTHIIDSIAPAAPKQWPVTDFVDDTASEYACDPNTGICGFTDDNPNTCSDGHACTTPDACLDGQCVGGPQTVCNSGNVCVDEQCSTVTGLCVGTNTTSTCDDGDPCTSGDVCSGGVCAGPDDTICDDGNDCTADSCDSNTPDGCVHTGIPGCCNTNAECADTARFHPGDARVSSKTRTPDFPLAGLYP